MAPKRKVTLPKDSPGERLRILRSNKQLTQELLGAKVGVVFSFISMCERGAYPIPSYLWDFFHHDPSGPMPTLDTNGQRFVKAAVPGAHLREQGLAFRRRLVAIMREHPNWNSTQLARWFGVSDMTIIRHRRAITNAKLLQQAA